MVDRSFPDADWVLLRKLSTMAYQRHCEASLRGIESLMGKQGLNSADKFDEISKLVRKRSKELRSIFDTFNLSRSNAVMILCSLYNWELITKDDLEPFTPETRVRILGGSE
jgi:hypothetical protein